MSPSFCSSTVTVKLMKIKMKKLSTLFEEDAEL